MPCNSKLRQRAQGRRFRFPGAFPVRLLAYVYIGTRFINAELVWQGYAEAATYPPNVRYADYFVGLQR